MSLDSQHFWLLGSAGAVSGAFLYLYAGYRRTLRAYQGTPGLKTVLSVSAPIMNVLPQIKAGPFGDWWFNIGAQWWFSVKHDCFQKAGQDIISNISLDNFGPVFIVADAEATQEILGNRVRFPKPTEVYFILELYGRNVVTTEGDIWRSHRRIAAPSFSDSNNRLVCQETGVVVSSLFEQWKDKEKIHYDNVNDLTMSLTLMVICSAGFGVHVPWEDEAAPSGHRLTFKSAVRGVSDGLMLKIGVPDKIMPWFKRTAHIQEAFEELHQYMKEMVKERSKSYRDYSDLFSNLIEANEAEEGQKLTNEELIGNIFIFLIAGHETTAHTLAFCLGLLALYPEVQEKLYKHTVEHVADVHGIPTYSELPNLTYLEAVFNESLRLFPPVTIIPKRSAFDTTLRTVNTKGEPVVVPIPKGAIFNIATAGIHYNPRYWKNPHEFKPERFLGDWPKHAFVPFSMGARSCIGRRFAEIEMLVALSQIVRNYRLEIKVDPKFADESFEDRRKRVLAAHDAITLTPDGIPVTFIKRH